MSIERINEEARRRRARLESQETRERAKHNKWAEERAARTASQEARTTAKLNQAARARRRKREGGEEEPIDLGRKIAEQVVNVLIVSPLGTLMDQASGISHWGEGGKWHFSKDEWRWVEDRGTAFNRKVAPDAMRKTQL